VGLVFTHHASNMLAMALREKPWLGLLVDVGGYFFTSSY
jgi:hypothetical protein